MNAPRRSWGPSNKLTARLCIGALLLAVQAGGVAANTGGRRAPLLSPDTYPLVLLEAYWGAIGTVPASCHLPVTLLEAIGEVESGGLRGRGLDTNHRAVPAILGPALNGKLFAAIRDTDHGRYDGDPLWDHAVGPMQFIPSTWARWGVDADRDGRKDPQDVDDAAAAAAAYLCAGGRDLSTRAGRWAAVFSYNHSEDYTRLVLRWMRSFATYGFLIRGEGVPMPTLTTHRKHPTRHAPVAHRPTGGWLTHMVTPAPSLDPQPSTSPTATLTPAPVATPVPSETPIVEPTPTTPAPEPTPSGTPTVEVPAVSETPTPAATP